jgi:streptogramin lyase
MRRIFLIIAFCALLALPLWAQSVTPTLVLQWDAKATPDGEFNPAGIAVDGQGNAYVIDYVVKKTGQNVQNNYRVRKFDPNGKFLMEWGEFGTGERQFRQATGILVDKDGNVYTADGVNEQIQKFDPNGKLLVRYGSKGKGDAQFQ